MAHSNGLITAPVNMKDDVQYVLFGSTSQAITLSALNTTSEINKYSRVKPVGNATFGLVVERKTMGSQIKAMYENANNWKFVPPDNSVSYPYKLVAYFNGYWHGASAIASVYVSPTQYYVEDTDMVFVQAQFNDQQNALNILDFIDIVKPQADNLYFGVVILGPNNTWTLVRNSHPLGENATTSSTEYGRWQRGIYLTSTELPFLSGYQATIYPVVTADYQSDPTPKTTGDIGINGNGITLPVSPVTVESVTIASYLHGSLSSIAITKSVNAYYATFVYSVQNEASRSYNFPTQTATFYICSRVQDYSGYQGWEILATFSASISSFTAGANGTVNRTITQLWSNATDPLVIGAADTSVSQLKVYLAMPGDIANAGFYDVTATATLNSIEITTYDNTIYIGGQATQWGITAHWSDGDTTPSSSEVTWSSNHTNIATVDAYGYVTGVSEGQVTITASYMGKTDSVTVNVEQVHVSSVVLPSNTTIDIQGKTSIEATIYPSNATNKKVKWNSSNTTNVRLYTNYSCTNEVDYTSFIDNLSVYAKGLGGGSSDITVTTQDGSETDSMTVTVKALDHLVVTGYHNVKVGDSFELGVIAYYTDNSREDNPSGLSWSGYSGYFTRSGRTFTGSSVGDCTITVSYTKNGVTKTESISARCIKPITEIRIREYPSEDIADNPIYLEPGDVIKLYAGVVPSDATIKGLSWSGGSGVFSIGSSYSAGGHNVRDITATGSGSGTLTVAATDEYGVTETRTINVYKYVTGVTLDESHLDLALSSGSTAVLTATITPSDANEWSTWEWKTSNSSVCTIVQNPSNRKKATVTAVGTGTTKVYLRIVSGLTTFRAECEVKVTQNPI